jgi:hypothetical protein
VANLLHDRVGADLFSDQGIYRARKSFQGGVIPLWTVEELVAGVFIGGEELGYLLAQSCVFAAGFYQERCATLGIEIESGVKDLLNALPAIRAGWLWPG